MRFQKIRIVWIPMFIRFVGHETTLFLRCQQLKRQSFESQLRIEFIRWYALQNRSCLAYLIDLRSRRHDALYKKKVFTDFCCENNTGESFSKQKEQKHSQQKNQDKMEIAWFSCCKYKLQQATTTPDNSCDQANGESDFLQVAAAPTAVAMPQAFAPSLSPGTTPYDDCNGLYTYMKTTHSTTHCSLIV